MKSCEVCDREGDMEGIGERGMLLEGERGVLWEGERGVLWEGERDRER